MTTVDTVTGEIVESLTREDARRLTDRIRLLGESLAETLDKLAELIDQARTGSAWLALGYRSWTEYVSSEFADVLPRLDREPRQEFVRELASRGMSTRAIAPIIGANHVTVARDLATPVANATPQTPAPESEREADEGAGQTPEGEASPPAPPVAEPAPRPPVTGLDGKTYRRPLAPQSVVTFADVMESGQAVQDASYLHNLLKAAREAMAVTTFDAERAGRIADESDALALDGLASAIADWHQRFNAQRSGLRLVKGDVQ